MALLEELGQEVYLDVLDLQGPGVNRERGDSMVDLVSQEIWVCQG